jgi:predicted nucleic acid-binding Zn ribbon protein
MIHLKRLLGKAIRKTGVARQIQAALILDEFMKILAEELGEKIKENVKPISVQNKMLTVACLSSVLAQEVQLREYKIKNQLNKLFGQEVVERIRFVT